MNTLQQTVIDTVSTLDQIQVSNVINIWKIVSLIELLIIVILLISCNKNVVESRRMKRKILAEGNIDFDEIVNNSFNSEKLYKDLLIKCHPDRFAPNEEKVAIANELSKRITESKHDVKGLKALRLEAINKLNIKI